MLLMIVRSSSPRWAVSYSGRSTKR
jgi:hypothetical protein